jgi:hypothetical protein
MAQDRRSAAAHHPPDTVPRSPARAQRFDCSRARPARSTAASRGPAVGARAADDGPLV